MYDIGLYEEILINELSGKSIICVNPPDLCSSQVHLVYMFFCKKALNCSLIEQIELGMGAGDDIAFYPPLQPSYDSRADHSTMPGNKYAWFYGHSLLH